MKKIIFIILMILAPITHAETTACVDAETNGRIIKLSINWDTKNINVNGRKLHISGENRNGTGILSNNYSDNNLALKQYLIFQSESMTGSSETWIIQFCFDENHKAIWPDNSAIKRMICSKSFIKPFLKYKYS